MVKFIPTEKLSKKEKQKLNNARRKTWGALNPVTRKPPNPKAYRRKKIRYEDTSFDNGFFYCLFLYSLYAINSIACNPVLKRKAHVTTAVYK